MRAVPYQTPITIALALAACATADCSRSHAVESPDSSIAGAEREQDADAAADGGGIETDASLSTSAVHVPPESLALDLSQLAAPTQLSTPMPLTLAEGPLWDPCGDRLLFTDVTASRIYALSNDDQVTVFAENTNNTNGIAFDLDGSLILAEMGAPGHIARLDRSGMITPIDPPGSSLHTPDDVTVRSDGTIYFSDGQFPPIGSINLSPLPVYWFKPGAESLQNGGNVFGPNGIELSPDEKTLYVDVTFQSAVLQFSVAPDGSLTSGGTFASGVLGADSLCLDEAGDLYVGVAGGLQVFRPDGSSVGLIPVKSAQAVTNCAFGGDDGKTLYITAWTSIWKLSGMPIAGNDWRVNRERVRCN
jgi:gluconolactonase